MLRCDNGLLFPVVRIFLRLHYWLFSHIVVRYCLPPQQHVNKSGCSLVIDPSKPATLHIFIKFRCFSQRSLATNVFLLLYGQSAHVGCCIAVRSVCYNQSVWCDPRSWYLIWSVLQHKGIHEWNFSATSVRGVRSVSAVFTWPTHITAGRCDSDLTPVSRGSLV